MSLLGNVWNIIFALKLLIVSCYCQSHNLNTIQFEVEYDPRESPNTFYCDGLFTVNITTANVFFLNTITELSRITVPCYCYIHDPTWNKEALNSLIIQLRKYDKGIWPELRRFTSVAWGHNTYRVPIFHFVITETTPEFVFYIGSDGRNFTGSQYLRLTLLNITDISVFMTCNNVNFDLFGTSVIPSSTTTTRFSSTTPKPKITTKTATSTTATLSTTSISTTTTSTRKPTSEFTTAIKTSTTKPTSRLTTTTKPTTSLYAIIEPVSTESSFKATKTSTTKPTSRLTTTTIPTTSLYSVIDSVSSESAFKDITTQGSNIYIETSTAILIPSITRIPPTYNIIIISTSVSCIVGFLIIVLVVVLVKNCSNTSKPVVQPVPFVIVHNTYDFSDLDQPPDEEI